MLVQKEKTITKDDGTKEVIPEVRRPASNAEINRELATLKRIFTLAVQSGRLFHRPHIPMLKESAPRSGFFEADQLQAVLGHLPAEIQPVIQFAAVTGWRIASEVLPLQWRQVDFDEKLTPAQVVAGTVRLDAGTTKSGEPRVFPLTSDLRTLLKAQWAEHEALRERGHLCPFVFFREVAEGRRGPKKPQRILTFTVAWKNACRLAGCPGRIPHDLRWTAIRKFVRVGVSERVAMRLSGHKTRSVFERYNVVADGDLGDAAAKLDFHATVSASVSAGQNRESGRR